MTKPTYLGLVPPGYTEKILPRYGINNERLSGVIATCRRCGHQHHLKRGTKECKLNDIDRNATCCDTPYYLYSTLVWTGGSSYGIHS